MNPVRFLLVGCGAIGERHAKLAAERGQLVAVCDVDEKRLKVFTRNYSCYGYTLLSDMLRSETADALLVCTPNGLHAVHSIAGLKAGLHVLCEKPMAIRLVDAKKMIAAARKAKRHLLIVKQNRYNPAVVAVKQLLNKGRLGSISSIQVNGFWNRPARYYQQSPWRGTKVLDGGTLYTQFSHFVDLLYWFFGPLKQVQGTLSNRLHHGIIETEDTGVFSFITKQGVPGVFHYSVNSARRNYEGSLTILAEKATIKIGGPYLNCIEYQEPVLVNANQLSGANKANRYPGYEGSMNNHALVYDAFLQVLAGKKKDYLSGEEGLHTVAMIEQMYKAGRKSTKAVSPTKTSLPPLNL
ncbi:MAG TPA: Gfo/Idh/MocA family oxidoreductase [Lacibacter sp.]|nr:Gfo/Idh/MocA family oxidoreductase [Lacibacter sp.]HMO88652.1 Gfo/Idh/MocA family oxidoreductase [Lacibacter sp.]